MIKDKFQERYLKHQENKMNLKENLGNEEIIIFKEKDFFEILESRRSQRIFSGKKINAKDIKKILKAIKFTPSSCNRQAIAVSIIQDAKEKNELDNILVGGKNWISKADKIFLLFAEMKAYKSLAEIEFMPYLDTGFLGANIYLICESLGIGCCFVNPNIREEDKKDFTKFFKKKNLRFCGAVALGHYDKKAKRIKKRSIKDIIL